jgi:uncharacterized protein
MTVHVSMHDVSPRWETEVDTALSLTGELGITPSLLVVPNFHGNAPLLAGSAFARKLVHLQERGHEMVLHGFYHLANGLQKSSNVKRFFRQNVVSGGEAEFASLTPKEAEERLDAGLQLFKELGLHTESFIAPAWSFRPWLLPMLRARGIRYTEDHFFSYDIANGTRRPNLLLNYATRTRERMFTTTVFNRAASSLMSLPLSRTRVAMHPKDMHFTLLMRETTRLLRKASAAGVATALDLVK